MCSNPQIGGVSAPRLEQKGGGNVPRNPERIPGFCWSKQKVYGLVVPCWVPISTLSVGIPIKSGRAFVCAQHPAFGHSEGRGPTENSFANRWELVGPLAGDARFSSFSQERCRIY